MSSSASESTSCAHISGSDRKCDLRLLSPKALETANWPFTLGTSPDETTVSTRSETWDRMSYA